MPVGLQKLAKVALPSILPPLAIPAMVVTTPTEVIFRILLLPLSATYKVPEASTVIPKGLLN